MDTDKNRGRPTDYKQEYCQQLISHMSAGYSYETFAAKIGVRRSTLYLWEKSHPEWVDAKEEAFDKCQMFWETIGMYGTLGIERENPETKEKITGKDVNPTMWIFNMKNRFNWKDKKEVEGKLESTKPLTDLVREIIEDETGNTDEDKEAGS